MSPCRSAGDELVVGVEADELDLAGEARLAQGEEHAARGRLVGREDPVRLVAEAVEQVLRGAVGGLAGGAAVLVGRDELDPGEVALHDVEEARLALLGAGGADLRSGA